MTLTQEDGSAADARTAAIHSAALGEISSPFRTMTFPRGIFVSTVSTEREAWSRRRAVSVASNVTLGRRAAARNAETSVSARPFNGPSAKRRATAFFVCDPYSTTSERSLRRVSRPVRTSRTSIAPVAVLRENLPVVDDARRDRAPRPSE